MALAALQAYRSSLSALLPDIVMPEPDGFGILEEMNRLHWIDALPTIIIFAETGGAYIDHAFALGASAYISRPFIPGIIRRRIMNAPARSKPAAVRKICSISCWYATGRSTSIPPPPKYMQGSK